MTTAATATLPTDLMLHYGSHKGTTTDGPCCLVEAEVVHVLHREKKTDSDPTICPVINAMATGLNDAYPDTEDGDRARTGDLTRFLGRLSGTKATPQVEEQRSLLALDWLIRVYTPTWLRLVPALVPDAVTLETAHRIDSLQTATDVGETVRAASRNAAAARAAAEDAAWDAAGDAAGAAARDAARDAAWAAAGDAARAAWDAAWDAAGDAARAAARAAWDALAPTGDALRASATELLDTMLAVTA